MALISRLQQSNLSLLMLVFLFIAACWIAHPREFLFLIFCNWFIQRPGVYSAKHAVQPSPAFLSRSRIPSLWAKRLSSPRGIGYEGRNFRLIFQCFFALVCRHRSTNFFPEQMQNDLLRRLYPSLLVARPWFLDRLVKSSRR
jgi:hypothetical protein